MDGHTPTHSGPAVGRCVGDNLYIHTWHSDTNWSRLREARERVIDKRTSLVVLGENGEVSRDGISKGRIEAKGECISVSLN